MSKAFNCNVCKHRYLYTLNKTYNVPFVNVAQLIHLLTYLAEIFCTYLLHVKLHITINKMRFIDFYYVMAH